MRRTLTSLVALGFAVGVSGAAVAEAAIDDDDAVAELETEFANGDEQAFADAGFEGARILHEAEVARVTDDEGNTFYVIGGVDFMGIGPGLDRATTPGIQDDAALDAEEPAGDLTAQVQEGLDPDAPDTELAEDPLAPETDPDVAADPAMPEDDIGLITMTLEDALSEAGIDDYEIVADAVVAEVMMGEGDGQPFFVIKGLEDAAQ